MVNEGEVIMENTISDFNNVITIFYGRETGIIRNYSQGRTDLKTYYGASMKDFNYDYIIVPRDEYVINNLEKFIVKNGELMMKAEPSLNKYKIAEV